MQNLTGCVVFRSCYLSFVLLFRNLLKRLIVLVSMSIGPRLLIQLPVSAVLRAFQQHSAAEAADISSVSIRVNNRHMWRVHRPFARCRLLVVAYVFRNPYQTGVSWRKRHKGIAFLYYTDQLTCNHSAISKYNDRQQLSLYTIDRISGF